ncbi:hypothetical protein ACFVR2_11000 [Gottfriedia sp. NPDC057991]|uniref:hypothetical protein n=1 Tax=Gottfriedia sp. NPDC057991 TaxID=3346298 RepID=UPI0036D78827
MKRIQSFIQKVAFDTLMTLRYAILGIRQAVLTVEVSGRHIYNLNGQTNNE